MTIKLTTKDQLNNDLPWIITQFQMQHVLKEQISFESFTLAAYSNK